MNAEMSCPTMDQLRRSLDPDDPMSEVERREIEAHVEGCQRSCKQAVATLLHADTLPQGPTLPPSHPTPEPSTTPAQAETPAVPGYEILGELGRGGMGVVYQARQVGLNRVVALKMILAGGHAGAEELARFQAEAEAVAAVAAPQHRADLRGRRARRPALLLAGVLPTAAAWPTDWPARPCRRREAAQLVERLARAMQAAHERGIIHRDLKPATSC